MSNSLLFINLGDYLSLGFGLKIPEFPGVNQIPCCQQWLLFGIQNTSGHLSLV